MSAFVPPWAHYGSDEKLIERLKDAGARTRIRRDLMTRAKVWNSERQELATFDKPNQLFQGMEYVLVNGVPVIDQGRMTGAHPGAVLRGSAYVP
jgi:hypothetical protein